jgi:hypothetical protein
MFSLLRPPACRASPLIAMRFEFARFIPDVHQCGRQTADRPLVRLLAAMKHGNVVHEVTFPWAMPEILVGKSRCRPFKIVTSAPSHSSGF